MKIVVSACLLGENCKYSGGNNRNERVLQYLQGHEVIPVCPEVMGGLPIPRAPAEIVDGIVRTEAGKSVDDEFRKGAQMALQAAVSGGAEVAILQSRSPSCGPKEIYDGTFSKTKVLGKGIFAQMLCDTGIQVIDVEDL